jgi:membrane-associated phospholipid phosphatase
MNPIVQWDRDLFLAINHGWRTDFLDRIMPYITDLGLGNVLAIISISVALVLGFFAGDWRGETLIGGAKESLRNRAWWLVPSLFSLIFCLTINIPKVIPRERPWWYYQLEHKAGRQLDKYVIAVPGTRPLRVRGFPSGHTASVIAVAMAITLATRRRKRHPVLMPAIWMAASLISFSRIYVADHWPLDVVGGALWGMVCGLCGYYMYQRKYPDPEINHEIT